MDAESIRYLRFPGGSTNTVSRRYGGKGLMPQLKTEGEQRGWQWVDWNVCAEDAVGGHPSADTIYRNVVRETGEQTHLSGREGAAGAPASDAATAGAAGEKGEKSGAAVSSFRLQPTGARAGTSHPAANAASAAASSPPHSPMRPPVRRTKSFIYKPLLCSGRSAAGTLSAYK